MNSSPIPTPTPPPRPTTAQKIAAYAVHVFTAGGVVLAMLAAGEVMAPSPRPKRVFLYLAMQVLIDALDGPVARAVDIKVSAPRIDGRKIDDIVDYLTYTFIPLLLIWRMDWVPRIGAVGGWWVAPAMVASLFGFANTGAKDEGGGFFLGFPSYWNIVAFYAGVWHALGGAAGVWINAAVIIVLTILTVMPVRFIYPNLAPRPWKWPVLIGGIAWTALLAWMWMEYPPPAAWLMWVSLSYPAFYVGLSAWLDIRSRQISATAERSSTD